MGSRLNDILIAALPGSIFAPQKVASMCVIRVTQHVSRGPRIDESSGHPASGGGGVPKEEDVSLTGLGQKSQGHVLSACLSCNCRTVPETHLKAVSRPGWAWRGSLREAESSSP